jgi:phosphoribosylformylglycinamidine cyclo-ligase
LKKYSYKSSGVSLQNAGRAIGLIKKPVLSTFNKNVLNDLGSFAGLYCLEKDKFSQPVLVSSTDGVGTKLLLAKHTGLYADVGQDLVAMCLNDIICCGAVPLFFLDYIACGKLVPKVIEMIVSSIAESCIECETSLIGGETAEMPGMYKKDDIDLAGFAVGIVEKQSIINPGLVNEGDIILGISSSGLHSNGFSLVRKIVKDKKLDLDKNYNFKANDLKNKKLGQVLMIPTRLYYKVLKSIYAEKIVINGIAHITGGGFYENINRIIPQNLDAQIMQNTWPVSEIFTFLKEAADIEGDEMYRVFNMGIGMVFIADAGYKERIQQYAKKSGEGIYVIGKVIKGSGRVRII